MYAGLLPGERLHLHRLVATAITAGAAFDGAGRRAAELAAHWWAAGEWADSMAASEEAADDAVAVWAFAEAHRHLEQALSAADRMPAGSVPAADRTRLLERASDAAFFAGEGLRSVELVREAIGSAGPSDSATLLRYHLLLGRNVWAIGDADAAFEAYRRAGALVPADPPSVELAQVMAAEARASCSCRASGRPSTEAWRRWPWPRPSAPGWSKAMSSALGPRPSARSGATTRASRSPVRR